MSRYTLAILSFSLLAMFAGTVSAESAPRHEFIIRADWFDSGNVARGEEFESRYPCIIHGGKMPNEAAYEIDFPITAEYTLSVLYTAASARPVELLLDGKKIADGVQGTTGHWDTAHAKWEDQCTIKIEAGRHTIGLRRDSCFPHICALRFCSSAPLPDDWRLNRQIARERTKAMSQKVKSPMGSWFNEVSADRAEKGESGSTFTDHLANETRMVALLEKPSTKLEWFDARQQKLGQLDRNNELTYFGGMFDQVDKAKPDWQIRVHSPGQQVKIPFSIERYVEMLHRTVGLVDRFRQIDGIADDYLEKPRAAAEADLSRMPEGATPDTESGRQIWFESYCRAARRYVDVAKANPLLDFDELLFVKRKDKNLGLPYNWWSNCSLPRDGFDDELMTLALGEKGVSTKTFFHPEKPSFLGDIDLHFDGEKLLFSAVGDDNRWNIFELSLEGKKTRQVTPTLPEADNYDACYLPDGAIVFSSTACYSAVPCVNGGTRVANLYRIEPDGKTIRRLCFDQEHNWCPTVLPNGRVLFLRWEYTDTPHTHTRLLFHMNPDGTGQMEYYGSNSYWPNSMFYARPIPGEPTKFVTIVSGHHGVRRVGELVVFDVSQGRREADGAFYRVCSTQKKIASKSDPKLESTLIVDNLVDLSWPKFLHPYPLDKDCFLVACQPNKGDPWGIYLADTADNLVLLKELPGHALFEPLPLKVTPKPPVIPSKIRPGEKEATVYMADIYKGEGLKGIPRGTVKQLRIVSYHYLYPNMGGPQGVVGMEGPWDIKRILGTVPVQPDGSAAFHVPANTPIAIQPLDAEGKSLQLMRSWFTAMPGEVLSCVGCHESQSSTPPAQYAKTFSRPIDKIRPWHGPTRGFNFVREVQPVLDRYCIGCHDGQQEVAGHRAFDLRGEKMITDYRSSFHDGGKDAGHFSTSYAELHRYVRRSGMESDYHLLMPMEFHADSTQLVQLLQKGHYGVKLDPEAWDRLYTWIDLNAPYHGTWTEIAGKKRVDQWKNLRHENLLKYANVDDDFEAMVPTSYRPKNPPAASKPSEIRPTKTEVVRTPNHKDRESFDQVQRPTGAGDADGAEAPVRLTALPSCENWPFGATEAKRRQKALGKTERSVDLGEGRPARTDLRPGRIVCPRFGRPAFLGRRATAPGHDRQAVLDRSFRGDQPPIRPIQPEPRQPGRIASRDAVRRSRLLRQRPRPTGRPPFVGRGQRVLRLAQSKDGQTVRPADRGPMGICLPGRDRDALFLW